MRRFVQVRLFFVLVALLLIPAATLPFAERLRTEWSRFWEPRPDELPSYETIDVDEARRRAFFESLRSSGVRPIYPAANPIFLSDDVEWIDVEELQQKSMPDPPAIRVPFKYRSERGDAPGPIEVDIPRFGENP